MQDAFAQHVNRTLQHVSAQTGGLVAPISAPIEVLDLIDEGVASLTAL
jgi:hypothetical protein